MSSESETERDGLLSYPGEWHALTIGIYAGVVTYQPWGDDWEAKADEFDDVDREPWYYKGGYILGTILQLVFVVVVLFAWTWFCL